MMKAGAVHIILVEPSHIISQGLVSCLDNAGAMFRVDRLSDLSMLNRQLSSRSADVILVNPSQVLIDEKIFREIKARHPALKWIGVVYSFFEPHFLSGFDGIITISDSPQAIVRTIERVTSGSNPAEADSHKESLSERETDVLKLLVSGLSNKEIADRLSISAHTVITHRKNISQKTGIRSVPGLTIYAVVKGLIVLDTPR